MMKMNKVFENTLNQIRNSTEVLKELGIVQYEIPMDTIFEPDRQVITWKNHKGGRDVSSKAFTTIAQYLAIVSSNAYQLLLKDYSIIRYSFTFCDNMLLAQNLLWWPCPVKLDNDTEEEFGLLESIKILLADKEAGKKFLMRTPIRVDFDASKNTEYHPSAHVHIQHHDCRINSEKPICFNSFIELVIRNFYPEISINFKRWNNLRYQYPCKGRKIEYINRTRLLIG